MTRIKTILILVLVALLSSCSTVSMVDKQSHCHPVKHKNHKMVKCSYSIFIALALAILSSCNALNKISGTKYWEEVCFEPYAYYDSSVAHRKQFLITPKTVVYVTDSTGTNQRVIIWGDQCKFQPGEMLKTKFVRSHSPSTGNSGWRTILVDQHYHYSYDIFK